MMRTLPSQSEMERAMLARDESYDGLFFVCVKTTRIFCRPSCPAKKPDPRNVEYHGTVRACLLAGHRPCKRCRPLATDGTPPEWMARLLARVECDPAVRLTDADLRAMDVSPCRARRFFVRNFNMTFHAYHRARRMGLALAALKSGDDPLGVALNHGFDSHSGFRDAFERTFGTTPGRSGSVAEIVTRQVETPVGPMVAGATSQGVCLLEFADRRAFQRQLADLSRRIGGAVVPGTNAHVDQLVTQLGEYFDGCRRTFDVPLESPGTPFQQCVWRELGRIPFGRTCSYEQLAGRIGRPTARRAVGHANGQNRIAVVIPCHRVIGSDGKLCGYGGGLWRKQFLLDLEGSVVARSAPSSVLS